MPVPVLYPKVSLEEVTGRISRWLVAEGEEVSEGQVIFEIENDKAAVEAEAPASGRLIARIAEGQTVEVGATVAQILLAGEGRPEVPPAPQPGAPEGVHPPAVPARPAPGQGEGRAPNPTPLARRMARENGLSLEGLAGSGPRGRVQRSDVQALLANVGRGQPVRTAEAIPGGARTSGADILNHRWLREGEGLPLVLLHGFSADLNAWRGFLAASQIRAPVLALDLPCHGGSHRLCPDDPDAIAAGVEATLEAAGVGACLMVGHSFGGLVAARIAARGQCDLRGLALIAPAGLDPQINGAFLAGVLRAATAASLKPWLQELVHDPSLITPAFLSATEEARRDPGLTAAMQRFAARVFPDATQAWSIRDDLAALDLPTRVIFGRDDRILPFRSTRNLPGRVALHAFDACGHLPHLEYPRAIGAILSEMRRARS
ncbi:acetoin dehydrogenase dihydrolipoyllysine-residue acetyltransferase subunit [Falsigemmobacter faecalis]|uniref:Acetoin dehydrogenase dihydrolipoyllysine-residue acetyltransferase subunit n=1 Tax=Falsigemmobacter faecalis TaxID=2488730 RepID=A0A3P3DTS9_9RHOB|nr:acetoin dehydrogenase dihydrolipoyllysine-residue acetyltransferase subunit [Falsigemmobacter faecalis]RRH76128.1 acetoin dehydrogenase dihydrolipoyllysine-residue acetyltransferase subunit [Falsigemmobacter faecalis]